LTYKGLVIFTKVSTFQNKFPSFELSLKETPSNIKVVFQQSFLDMKTMVEEIYKKKIKNEEGPIRVKGEGCGSEPPKNPPYPSSPLSSSSSSIP